MALETVKAPTPERQQEAPQASSETTQPSQAEKLARSLARFDDPIIVDAGMSQTGHLDAADAVRREMPDAADQRRAAFMQELELQIAHRAQTGSADGIPLRG